MTIERTVTEKQFEKSFPSEVTYIKSEELLFVTFDIKSRCNDVDCHTLAAKRTREAEQVIETWLADDAVMDPEKLASFFRAMPHVYYPSSGEHPVRPGCRVVFYDHDILIAKDNDWVDLYVYEMTPEYYQLIESCEKIMAMIHRQSRNLRLIS